VKHVVTFREWEPAEILRIIDLAARVKESPRSYADRLAGETLILLFQKTSTRTRVSFEVGTAELGGTAVYLDWRTTNIPITDLQYETRYLCRNCFALMARLLHHADMRAMAEVATVPLINGLDDMYHPTQALSDYFTLQEKWGSFEGRKLVYVGVHNNVANSLLAIGPKLGVEVCLVTPLANEASLDEALLDEAAATGLYRSSDDLRGEVLGADAVYVDTWVDMEFYTDPAYEEERTRRERAMMPFKLTRELLDGSDALILHDMPIHPGFEIEPELVDDPRSVIFDQAENLRHARKALLLTLEENRERKPS